MLQRQALGWMSVDGRGLAVPSSNQTACEQLNPSMQTKTINYRKVWESGMDCDFEEPNACLWSIVPHSVKKQFGEDGLARLLANRKYYGKTKDQWRRKSKDGTLGEKNKGHYLIFQANYIDSANTECSPSFSHIESPWIEQSNTECELKFDFFMDVGNYAATNDHAYHEVTVSDKSHGVVPFAFMSNPVRKNGWNSLVYKIGKWSKFKFDIAFFRGLNESRESFFAIDDIELMNCLPLPSDVPLQCHPVKQHICPGGACVSKTRDLCDFHPDCPGGEDERLPMCYELEKMRPAYHCDFRKTFHPAQNVAPNDLLCDWTVSGKMRWKPYSEGGIDNFMMINMSEHFNKELVTVGMLRSPELPPPPAWNDDDKSNTSDATFHSCFLRLFLRVTGRVENVDMFEVEVVENIPFTRVSRGNRVKKKMQFKVRDRVRDFGQKWNKIEMVIPTGMKYRYFIQLNAIKSPDISGPQHYILGVKDISFSPQCLGLGAPPEVATRSCHKREFTWRHDMDTKEIANCMDVPIPEEPVAGLDSVLFSSCGTNVGPFGPLLEHCISYYESLGGNNTEVDMVDSAQMEKFEYEKSNQTYLDLPLGGPPFGIQKWEVPDDGLYTVVAKGGSGGHGRLSRKSSHGATLLAIMELHKGEVLYILVGQEGESACVIEGVETREGLCSQMGLDDYRAKRWVEDSKETAETRRSTRGGRRRLAVGERSKDMEAIHLINKLNKAPEKMQSDDSSARSPDVEENSSYPTGRLVLDYNKACTNEEDCQDWIVKIKEFRPSYQGGGGGGGGGTFIFKVDPHSKRLVPIIVAGGGGGMGDIYSEEGDPDSLRLFPEREGQRFSEIVPQFG